jgi:hypothetical protein
VADAAAADPCTHPDFDAKLILNRIQPDDDAAGMPRAFTAEVTVQCSACATPFMFPGMAAGLSYDEPRTSIDGTELRAPMRPINMADIPSGLPSVGARLYIDERPS